MSRGRTAVPNHLVKWMRDCANAGQPFLLVFDGKRGASIELPSGSGQSAVRIVSAICDRLADPASALH